MAFTVSPSDLILLKDAATRLRINSIKSTAASNSGHPTSCSSIADIMAVLFLKAMKYDTSQPDHPANDRFILSKGHAAPVLYAALYEVGIVDEDLTNLRKLDSILEGHPTPKIPFVDVATGSLGQGLSNAVGMAYIGKYVDKASYRVYTIIGDGESAEGSIWEAMQFAQHYKLDNIVAIFDINRLGQSEATAIGHDMEVYRKRCEAFGWMSIIVDGHNIEEFSAALNKAASVKDQPVAIVAKTYKGFDFLQISDASDWHGKPLGDNTDTILAHLSAKLTNPSGDNNERLIPTMPTVDCVPLTLIGATKLPEPLTYALGTNVATRMAYGNALQRLGEGNERVFGLDGDTKNSTYSIKLKQSRPAQFIECFIAEQNMVGVAIGCGCRERTIPFVSAFAAFFTRAYDQIRMGVISQTDCNFVGSHVGVSIGEDGPSQMALEDLAMFRSLQNSTVFYPTDAVATQHAVEFAANTKGICYIRTGRPALPVLYTPEEKFAIGKGKVLRSSTCDKVTIVAAGVTLYEALTAGDILTKEGINVRVIDPFTIKPLDEELVRTAIAETKGLLLVVEDHAPEGGIGEAVSSCIARGGNSCVIMEHLAVRSVPRSGKPHEMLRLHEIDSQAIIEAVKRLIAKRA